VVELDAHADRGLAGAKVTGERGAGSLFAECDDPRGRENGYVAGCPRARSVGFADHQIRLTPQAGFYSHRRYDTASIARPSIHLDRTARQP
jgi:hypothetical protein